MTRVLQRRRAAQWDRAGTGTPDSKFCGYFGGAGTQHLGSPTYQWPALLFSDVVVLTWAGGGRRAEMSATIAIVTARGDRPGGEHPADALGMDAERFRQLGHLLVDRVADHWSGLDRAPAMREVRASQLVSLGGALPMEPGDVEELLEQLAGDALENMQHAAHRRFFARVPSPASFTGILGDWISTGFNTIAASWAGGSGPSALELTVVDWIRELMGFPAGSEGVLVSGGSLGNMTALAAARHAGYDAAVYVSDQTHASILRALRVLGFAPDQVVVVPATDGFRWSLDEVGSVLRAADRGRAIVVATAGTTNTGAVDPLDGLADLCAERDLWLHVDGAYGAPAALAPAGRAALQGMERADSLAVDPHKWLFQPYDVGCVLVRPPGALEACFAMNPEYLRDVQASAAGEADLRNRGLELTRRSRAAKLWLTFKAHGAPVLAEAIGRCIALTERVQSALEADQYWDVFTPAQLGVITFTARELSGAEHLERARLVTASGFAAVSCTELAGRTVYRLCLINPRTTLEDVTETLTWLKSPG
jgi:aromatic-L-amino-acid decarboxylase